MFLQKKNGVSVAVSRQIGLVSLLDTGMTSHEQCGDYMFILCFVFCFFMLEYVVAMFVH